MPPSLGDEVNRRSQKIQTKTRWGQVLQKPKQLPSTEVIPFCTVKAEAVEFMSAEVYSIHYKVNWSIFFKDRACVGRGQADWSSGAFPPLNSSILWLMVIDLTAYTLFFSYQCYKIQELDCCQVLKFCSVDHLSAFFLLEYCSLAFWGHFPFLFLVPEKCLRDTFSPGPMCLR